MPRRLPHYVLLNCKTHWQKGLGSNAQLMVHRLWVGHLCCNISRIHLICLCCYVKLSLNFHLSYYLQILRIKLFIDMSANVLTIVFTIISCYIKWYLTSMLFYCIYLSTPWYKQDMTQSQLFLSRVQQVCIQSFPSPRLVAIPRLKSPVFPTIYL